MPKVKKTLPPLRDFKLGVTHNRITDRDEIVQADWGYNYDVAFITGVPDPMDWRVDSEWVGQRACDCAGAWDEFLKPIEPRKPAEFPVPVSLEF